MESEERNNVEITISKPKRILHFSDGVVEEFDENDGCELKTENVVAEPIDPKSLTWGPWISHYAWSSGAKVLNAVDYVGETLADFFGITTPKYQLEISEYERLQEEKRKLDEESSGWSSTSGGDIPLVLSEQPKVVNVDGSHS